MKFIFFTLNLFFIFGFFNGIKTIPSAVFIFRHGEKEIEKTSQGKKKFKKATSEKSREKTKKMSKKVLKGQEKVSKLLKKEAAKGEKPVYGDVLNDKGWRRAYALANNPFLLHNDAYGIPVALFASAPVQSDGSLRPIQTITPLSDSLGLEVNKSFTIDNKPELVKEIMSNPQYHNKLVVISFEHNNIPELATLFGAKKSPNKWPDNVFDRIWVLEFNTSSGDIVKFSNEPQKMLFGDSKK